MKKIRAKCKLKIGDFVCYGQGGSAIFGTVVAVGKDKRIATVDLGHTGPTGQKQVYDVYVERLTHSDDFTEHHHRLLLGIKE